MFDFDQHSGWHFLKCPNYVHSLCECFQVMKPNFDAFAIDRLFGSPGNGNAGTRRGHYDNVSTRAAEEVTDIAIVWKNSWPQLQVRGRLEDRHLRRAHDDGVGFVHWN